MKSLWLAAGATPIAVGLLAFSSIDYMEVAAIAENSTPPQSEEPAGNQEKVLVRFMNAQGDEPADLSFGDKKAFLNVSQRTVTSYQPWPAESCQIRLGRAGDDGRPLATDLTLLRAGNYYTVIAILKPGNKFMLSVFKDDPRRPTDLGKAKARVIHSAGGVGQLDVFPTQGEETLFRGVNFDSATSYLEVDARMDALEVREKRSKAWTMRLPVRFEPGKVYSVILSGGPARGIEGLQIEDGEAAGWLPLSGKADRFRETVSW